MFLRNTVRSPRAPAGSSMPVGGAFVASQGQGPCADWRQLPLLQRSALRNRGENEIPCPTFSISYIGRKDQSVMAAAAYNAGEKMYSERDHEWKHPHSSPARVVYREVMLPDNAPREYADSQALWNAVDAAEKRKDAQTARRMLIVLPKELTYEQNLALIRDYCQREFVSKGMIQYPFSGEFAALGRHFLQRPEGTFDIPKFAIVVVMACHFENLNLFVASVPPINLLIWISTGVVVSLNLYAQ